MSDSLSDDLPELLSEGRTGASDGFPSLEELGQLLPQYEMHQVIGIGGMGAVYLARQPHLDRWVALKVLPASAAQNPEDSERFNTEARAMARLAHPHIVAVFDFGQTAAGHLYLAMEYVEGADLHWRTRAGEITPERARAVIAQLCEALQYAHEHGVIHRDIKPANILITPDWQVKVVDFGLARDLTLQPSVDVSEYGTPDYTAPERFIAGAPVDHRADVYSLGVVIHEILTGKTPRAAGASAGLGLPDGFAGVLSKCLMHDPARRYQKASDVRAALLAAAATAQKKAAIAPVNPPTAGPRRYPAPMQTAPTPVADSAWLGTLGWALACVVALGGLGWLVWKDHFQKPLVLTESEALASMPSPVVEPQVEPMTEAPKVTSAVQTMEPGNSSVMGANNSMAESVALESPSMNQTIPTTVALIASTASALSVDYARQIKPILAAKCYECHSEEKGKEKGDVALDTEAKLKAIIGPDQYIIPGNPAVSVMLRICKLPDDDEDVMPPRGKNRLTAAEIALLETWIKEGASLTSSAAKTPVHAPLTWTSSDGKAIEASFVTLVGDQITLRMSDTQREFTFPLSRLSAESQAQAKAAAAK
ncbi:serine/threonine-protein kinase [Prosthecobacter dejongeii]|uniref:Non-specific serine/threonine protein kinase n=1 Tax=Prosthecobacter dejongeii TaxID=48465 RepID=A0A7W7YJM8_9BACT|nr:serine/threonine-protein kinase [Prosthecobacter dejongeii]MBB5037334.1 hypothetical protein [Prosthecobacter dejongeii]